MMTLLDHVHSFIDCLHWGGRYRIFTGLERHAGRPPKRTSAKRRRLGIGLLMAIGAGALSFGLGAAGEVTGALALRQRGRAAQDPRTCRIARFCYRRSIYARAVGSRFFQFHRRSNGRPGGHAGLCIIPYPALASPPRRDHAVIRCHQRWHRDHARFGVGQVVLSLGLPTRWWLLSG